MEDRNSVGCEEICPTRAGCNADADPAVDTLGIGPCISLTPGAREQSSGAHKEFSK